MGIAEITPGISGATIAGLFNVYKDFVTFLNVFNPFKIKPNLKYFLKIIDIIELIVVFPDPWPPESPTM